MLHSASQWLKRTIAVLSLTAMILSTAPIATMAFTINAPGSTGSSGTSTGTTTTSSSGTGVFTGTGSTSGSTTTGTTTTSSNGSGVFTGVTTGTSSGTGNTVLSDPPTNPLPPGTYPGVYTPGSTILTNVYANPTSFNASTGGQTTISFTLSTPATVMLNIMQNGTLVSALYGSSGQHMNAGSFSNSWNGTYNNGTSGVVPSGTYEYLLTAKADISGMVYNAQDYLTVTSSSTTGTPVSLSTGAATPNPFNPSSSSTSVSYTLNTQANLTIDVVNSSNSQVAVIAPQFTQNAGTFSAVWNGIANGTQAPAGNYSLRFTATNSATTTPVVVLAPVTVTYGTNGGGTNCTSNYGAPTISGLTASPSTFNPYSQSTNINYSLNNPANVTIQIMNGSNTLQRTIASSVCQSSGTNLSYSWDGRDMYGNVVPSGNYTVTATATNNAGTNTEYAYVTVTNNGNNNNCSYINGVYTCNNGNNCSYVNGVYTCNNGNNCSYVNSVYTCNNGNNCSYINGTYTCNNTNCTYVNGVCQGGNGINGSIITGLYAQPQIFNPLTGQTTVAYYNLNQTATVTTQIVDPNGIVIRTLVAGITRYSNSNYNNGFGSYGYSDSWNGRDINGNIIPDNNYQFRITATTPSGLTDTESTWVQVSTNGNIIGFPNGSTCAGYIDVTSNSPYCNAIQLMKNDGVFSGYSDGTFRPDQPINRAETVKVILMSLNIPVNTVTTTIGGMFFDTDPTAWYAPYVSTAKNLGIISGYPNGSFKPNQTVNRVELLKVFLNASGLTMPYCNTAPYNDTPITAATRWYMNFVCYSKTNDLMHDDGNGNFHPDAPMTRGDVADLFYQFDTKGLYSSGSNPYVNGTYNSGNNNNCPYINGSYNCSNNNCSYINSSYNCNNGTTNCTYVNGISTCPYNNNCTYINGSYSCPNNCTYINGTYSCPNTTNNCSYVNGVYTCNNGNNCIYNNGIYNNTNCNYNNTTGLPNITLSTSPTSFNPNIGESTNIYYSLNQTVNSIQIQVVDSSGVVRRNLYNTGTSSSSNTIIWNGRDDSGNLVPYGNYIVRVNATNSYGTGTSSTSVFVNSTGTNINNAGSPVVSNISLSPSSFGASSGQTTTITYWLNNTGTVSVQVLNSFGNVVRNINANNTGFTNTANTTTWNGRDDSNNLLPAGSYIIRVTATNYAGTGTNTAPVTIY